MTSQPRTKPAGEMTEHPGGMTTPTPEAAEEQISVLVVDDEGALRSALARFFRNQGYDVRTANSGAEAMRLLHDRSVSLMLLDIRMPGMSGIDMVSEALGIDPEIAILMLSGLSDATSAAICMQRGAMDYLTKPIDLGDLEVAVRRALKHRDTMLQNSEIASWLREEVERRTQEVERERLKQQQITLATLEALVNALEAKNSFLAGHSARVAAYSASMAQQLGMSDDEVEQVRMAGRLHDLGMIGTREAVLEKNAKLTDEEYEHIKQHVIIGADIMAPLTHLGPVVDWVRSHHEHWDGSGYPDGLKGDTIPLGARIICAAEVYDALTTARPYQEKLDPQDAVARMRQLAGKVIDPDVQVALALGVKHRKTLVFLDDDRPATD